MRNVLAAFWPSIWRMRLSLTIMLSLLLTAAVLELLQPLFLSRLVAGFESRAPATILWSAFWMIAAFMLTAKIFWRLFDLLYIEFQLGVLEDLARRSFTAFQQQSLRFFEAAFSGSLVRQEGRMRSSFDGSSDIFLFSLSRNVVLIIVILVQALLVQPWLGLIFAGWLALFITANVLLSFWKYGYDEVAASKESAMSGALADSLSNRATVVSYGREADEDARFGAVAKDSYRHTRKAWLVGAVVTACQSTLMATIQLTLLAYMIYAWEAGTVTVGEIVCFQGYIALLCTNLWNFGNDLRKLFQFTAEASDMAAVYLLTPEVCDREDAVPLTVSVGEVRFEAVGFSYTDNCRREVHNLTFRVPGGSSLGLVGRSGSGKTTAVRLLQRIFDVKEGAVLIDGQDVRAVTLASLHSLISVVPQQPDLFHRTLWENIAFGRPEATEEEIIAAAKRAYAWEFISELPEGLQTMVGERGVKLSGGQRQRIVLARAFLADRPILILDEATSALDSEIESLIREAIADLMKGRTTIVIAHRLSTVQHLDRIVVLKAGQLVEDGTHDELVAAGGLYALLWSHQTGGYLGQE